MVRPRWVRGRGDPLVVHPLRGGRERERGQVRQHQPLGQRHDRRAVEGREGLGVWILQGNTLVLLRVFEVGGYTLRVTLSKSGGGFGARSPGPWRGGRRRQYKADRGDFRRRHRADPEHATDRRELPGQ